MTFQNEGILPQYLPDKRPLGFIGQAEKNPAHFLHHELKVFDSVRKLDDLIFPPNKRFLSEYGPRLDLEYKLHAPFDLESDEFKFSDPIKATGVSLREKARYSSVGIDIFPKGMSDEPEKLIRRVTFHEGQNGDRFVTLFGVGSGDIAYMTTCRLDIDKRSMGKWNSKATLVGFGVQFSGEDGKKHAAYLKPRYDKTPTGKVPKMDIEIYDAKQEEPLTYSLRDREIADVDSNRKHEIFQLHFAKRDIIFPVPSTLLNIEDDQ